MWVGVLLFSFPPPSILNAKGYHGPKLETLINYKYVTVYSSEKLSWYRRNYIKEPNDVSNVSHIPILVSWNWQMGISDNNDH